MLFCSVCEIGSHHAGLASRDSLSCLLSAQTKGCAITLNLQETLSELDACGAQPAILALGRPSCPACATWRVPALAMPQWETRFQLSLKNNEVVCHLKGTRVNLLLEENLNFRKILSGIPEVFLIKLARCEVLVSHMKCVKIFRTSV